MRRNLIVVLLMVFMATALWHCSKLDENTVAKIGSEKITLSEFEDQLNQMRKPKFVTAEEEMDYNRKQLEKLIERKLYVQSAYDMGLDKDSALAPQLADLDQKLMLRSLFNEVIVKKVSLTDEEVKKFYEEQGTELKASHILVAEESEANDLYKQVTEGGADFAKIATERSLDTRSGQNGGDLGYFTKMDMVPEFSEMAFSLEVGEISKPVQTNYGYHIIKVTDRRSKEQKPFEQEKDRLKSQLENLRQRERSMAFIDTLFEEAKIEFKPDAVKLVIEKTCVEDTGKPMSPGQPYFSEDEAKQVLFTYSYGEWTIGEFEAEMQKVSGKVPAMESEEQILNYVKRILQPELLTKKAEELKITESESFKELYKQSLEEEMERQFKKEVIDAPANITEEDERNYYDQHQDEFMGEPMVNVREIQVDSEEQAKQLMNQLNAGANFAELAEKHTLRVYAKRKGGELGLFPEKRYPELFAAAWKLEPDQIAGPINAKGNYSIIQLINKQEAALKPFEEVRRSISSKLQQEYRETSRDNWLAEAYKKYKVIINEKALSSLVDESQYETQPEGIESPKSIPQAPQVKQMEVKPSTKAVEPAEKKAEGN
ncbi:MAG: peptidylprolyl isomerase [Bacteroidales bacterium]|nr:peptidylprolyl isomerase [Bacteroidales bacterium]